MNSQADNVARKAAAVLIATAMIASSFGAIVPTASAHPVPVCTADQTYDSSTGNCVDNPVTPPVVTPTCDDNQTLVNNVCVDNQNNNWNGDGDNGHGGYDNDHGDHGSNSCDPKDHYNDSNDCDNHGGDNDHGGDNNGNRNGGGSTPTPPVFVPGVGVLSVVNVIVGGTATSNQFSFAVNGGANAAFNANGENDMTVATGTYSVLETATTTYTASYSNCTGVSVNANATTTCTITNTLVAPAPVTINASSVVCSNPNDLPNWGAVGHPAITSTSATGWVAAHSSCSLVPGWSFEYADQTAPYGGDKTIGHVDGYTAFGPTDSLGSTTVSFNLGSMTQVQVREQLQGGFIPFTYTSDNTNSTVPSAQMYCADDVLNYDNSDYVKTPVAGSTYYCVSFNSPQPATPATPSGGSAVAPANTSGGGGGGVVISGPLSIGFVNTNTGGLVLGTSTVADDNQPAGCSALLSTYMRAGMHNDPSQVSKLQSFLNAQLGLNIPVTGYFGASTKSGVNAFQVKYQNNVLMPWTPFGLDGHTPTGYVYKTTEHEINALSCASLNLPAPQLP